MAEPSAERTAVLLTTVGADRPGIVEDISAWVLECGGNIEDSRMAVLGGEFATIILVSGPAELARQLEAGRAAFEQRAGLTVLLKAVAPARPAPGQPALRYALQATSLDHAGIVHRITSLLRAESINIVTASTHTSSAPFTGAPVFHVKMEIDIPANVSVARLRARLGELGEEQNIDFMLKAEG